MRIPLAELRRITNQLYDHLEAQGLSSVEVPNDYYWEIPKEQRRDVYRDPVGFTTGQTSDDWEELRKILSGESEPIGYALVWLAALLREIGEEVVR